MSISLILNDNLKKAKTSFRDSAGLDFDYTIAFFDIFYGISVNNLSISKDKDKIFDIGSIRLKIGILNTIFKRQLLCEEIFIQDPHLYKVDHFDKTHLSFLLAIARDSEDILKSAKIEVYNLNFMELANLDIGGYIALAQNKLLLSRGKVRILESAFLGKTDFDQSNSLLDEPLDYAFETTYLDDDFVINKLDLIGFIARFIMSGRIKDYESNFDLDLKGELRDFLLEDVKQLNNEYIYSRGILGAKFYIKGPIENADFSTDIKISDSNLKILDFLKIDKINSNLIWDNKGFRSKKISGSIDNAPISLSLDIGREDEKKIINLELSSQNLDLLDDIRIKFQGGFLKNILGCDIEIEIEHTYNKKSLTRYFNFDNLYLSLDDFEFNCDSADIQFGEVGQSQAEKKLKKLLLKKLSGNITIVRDSLELYNFEAGAFGGFLKADASFSRKENALQYNARVILDKLDAAEMVGEFLSGEFQLSGLLSGSINLNSKLRENISGDIQILNGDIANNAVLVAISDFFGIPSLKKVAFSNLKVIFYKVWNQYTSKISLFSPDVAIYVDNKSFEDDSLDGYLLVKLATVLTDESPKFRRLFKYIGYKEPMVYFPFQLKGYAGKPRIEWLENEFKEKLQDFLPESNKRLLQEALNKMVEDFSE
ncbi:DUF3971 domain-containing protein [Candidatus Omnitrophota bacterium]